MQELNSNTKSSVVSKNVKGPSKIAESVAMIMVKESKRPENERICYDPYAVHFIGPKTTEYHANHRTKAEKIMEQIECLGIGNSFVARVRYFDDIVKSSINDGLDQLVILGAGYDTRAYRIEQLNKIRVFEVDHPITQRIKTEKIKEIFGSLPSHVTYVPVDFEADKLSQKLVENNYDSSKKTLFIMEGLLMYITPKAVADTLSFLVENSGNRSSILFDYYSEFVVDKSYKRDIGTNIRNFMAELGEPLQFGIKEEEIEDFLIQFGFSRIQNVISKNYKYAYFHGKNKNRNVCKHLYFVHATIDK